MFKRINLDIALDVGFLKTVNLKFYDFVIIITFNSKRRKVADKQPECSELFSLYPQSAIKFFATSRFAPPVTSILTDKITESRSMQ